ncbi:hypothetical protein [Neisseria elongata]|uniref:hypothetical protein n=1 Tax=Neisseria elongata TaxID=495 RepID=UPI0028E911FC|nr:hypothetical protein [Neisseria elongata]
MAGPLPAEYTPVRFSPSHIFKQLRSVARPRKRQQKRPKFVRHAPHFERHGNHFIVGGDSVARSHKGIGIQSVACIKQLERVGRQAGQLQIDAFAVA